jgi:transcriptional regulator with XRE-family HTH domain
MTGNRDSARGARLRRERELRGWSQADVASKIGVPSPFHVSRWERGVVTPSPRYRQRYCELFDRTAAELGFVSAAGEETGEGTGDRARADDDARRDSRPARRPLPWQYTCPDCGRSIPLSEILPITTVGAAPTRAFGAPTLSLLASCPHCAQLC